MRLPPPVLALSPGGLKAAEAQAWLDRVRHALAAGLRGVLLREPGLDERDFLALARELRALTREVDGWLGVHDRAHAAKLAEADGLHVGFRSLPPSRVPWRAGLAVGFSAHAGDGEASWKGADYLFFGPVRDTPSKRGLVAPAGFDGLAAAVRGTELPVWGIGGLRPGDVPEVFAAGAAGVCALSGILGAEDPGAAAEAYLTAAGARAR